MGARKSPKSWLDRSVAVPTWTSRSPGAFGSAPAAAQPQHLAAGRRAAAREAPARQADVAREPLDSGERHEVAGDGALPEEHDRRRPGQPDVHEPAAHLAVERRVRLRRADGDAEPDGAHRARGGGDPLDRLRDTPVLRDLRAGEDADEDRRSDGDADRREQRSRRPPPDPPPGERDDVGGRSRAAAPPGFLGHGLRPCRERRGPVFRPPPRRNTTRSARTTADR